MSNKYMALLFLALTVSPLLRAADDKPVVSSVAAEQNKPGKLTEQEKKEFEEGVLNDSSFTDEEKKDLKEYFAYLRELETWPKTVDAAVARLLIELPDDSKKVIADTPKTDLIKFLRDLGMGIRSKFGLWKGNPELTKSACPNDCDPEAASMVIIEALWEKLQSTKETKPSA